MAFFTRANLNSLSILNHCYCKFSAGIVKLKSLDRASYVLQSEKPRAIDNEKTVDSNNISPFDSEIIKRRNQASRSILVQVYSANSYDDLQSYCSQFGQILSMHHYQLNKQHNYILVEFQNVAVVNEVLSHASFVNQEVIVSAKSPVLWFRKGHPISFHNRKTNQKKMPPFTENGWALPTDTEITKLLSNAKSISGQIISLYEALKLDDLEIRLRFHTAYHLEKYFLGLLQNIKVLPFGSSINGFGRKRCDVDLVIVPNDFSTDHNIPNRLVFHTKPMKRDEKHETKEFLHTVASAMQYFIPGVQNVRRILEARVPIIKFNYEYTHLECDLSTTNMTAIYMSELLFLYGEVDWRVRPLVVAIRQWAKAQGITSDSPGCWITNFSLTLLVLFYLQQKNLLPSLNALKTYATSNDTRFTETGIDCTFLRDIRRLPIEYMYKVTQDNLETLFHGFFEYYATFDFYTKGICIREGIPIRKPTRTALHITNPLETTLNVSRNVNVYELNRITQKAHDALYILETADNSISSCSVFMTLLDIKIDVNRTNFNSKIKKDIPDFSKDHSYAGIDIAQEVGKKKTKKTV